MKITDLVMLDAYQNTLKNNIDRLRNISKYGPQKQSDIMLADTCVKWSVLQLQFIEEQENADE
jgi:hypothetical protein